MGDEYPASSLVAVHSTFPSAHRKRPHPRRSVRRHYDYLAGIYKRRSRRAEKSFLYAELCLCIDAPKLFASGEIDGMKNAFRAECVDTVFCDGRRAARTLVKSEIIAIGSVVIEAPDGWRRCLRLSTRPLPCS